VDCILQLSGNLIDLGRLSREWVEYGIANDYQQYQISTKLVTQITSQNNWRIIQRYGISNDLKYISSIISYNLFKYQIKSKF